MSDGINEEVVTASEPATEDAPVEEAAPATEAIAPELTEEEKARMEAERVAAEEAARAEAERLAIEEAERAAAEAARIKAEEEAAEIARLAEEKQLRVIEQTPRAHQLVEYALLSPSESDSVDQILATLEPEAVEAGRAQVQAEQDEVKKQLAHVSDIPGGSRLAATSKPKKRNR